MNCNFEEAKRFLNSLDNATDVWTLQAIFDNPALKDGKNSRIRTGKLEDLWDWIEKMQQQGYGIFVTAQRMDGKGRKLENLESIRCIFQEDDNSYAGDFPIEPSLVVNTSPGKYHRYWIIDPHTTDKEAYKTLMQVLVHSYGSDKNAVDLSRVLRLPGTRHLKGWTGGRGGYHDVTLVEDSEETYTLEQLQDAFGAAGDLTEVLPYVGQKEEASWAATRPVGSLLDKPNIVLRLAQRWNMDERDDWLHCGMALHHQYSGADEGLTVWDEASRDFDKYEEGACAERWETFGSYDGEIVTIRSLIENGRVDEEAILFEIETRGLECDIEAIAWDIKVLRDRGAQKRCREALKRVTGEKMSVINSALKEHEAGDKEDAKKDDMQLAREVVASVGDDIIHADGCLWWYTGRIWKRLSKADLRSLVMTELGKMKGVRVMYSRVSSVAGSIEDLLHKVGSSSGGVDDGEPLFEWNRIGRDAVAVRNGVVEPGKEGRGVLRPHRKSDFLTSVLPCNWRPGMVEDGEEYIEDRFLDDIMEGDRDKVRLLWEMIGYSLQKHCRFEKFFILIGEGKNGKSVFIEMFRALFGRGQVSMVTQGDMGKKERLVNLVDSYVNLLPELPKGVLLSDTEIKLLTSGDPIEVRELYERSFVAQPSATLVMGTNHLPYNRDTSKGILRRAVIVPFNWEVPEKKVDRDLRDKLTEENVRDRVLVKALRAYWAMVERADAGEGWTLPHECEARVQDWQDDLDPFRVWFREYVKVTGRYVDVEGQKGVDWEKREGDWFEPRLAYTHYVQWHHENVGGEALKQRGFARRIFGMKGIRRANGGGHKKLANGARFLGHEMGWNED